MHTQVSKAHFSGSLAMALKIHVPTLTILHIMTRYSSSKPAFFTSSSVKVCVMYSEIKMKIKQEILIFYCSFSVAGLFSLFLRKLFSLRFIYYLYVLDSEL